MGNFRRDYNRFLNRNRNKGIPRLMLWVCIGNAVVFVMQYLLQVPLTNYLYFDTELILRGQVWRLFTYIFTFASESIFLMSPLLGAIISIMFYYWIGALLENTWSTLRFNIFYFSGVLLMDAFAVLLTLIFGFPITLNSHYLNLSLFLAAATLIPNEKVYLYAIIPVKMRWMAWVDIILTAATVVQNFVAVQPYWKYFSAFYIFGTVLYALLPLAAIGNYFIFFGRNVSGLLPDSWRRRGNREQRKRRREFRRKSEPQPNPDWAQNYRSSSGERPYRHKCTVCGRTDTDCPDLEFRYCSKCKGYFCYCIDHINNHTHIQ